jgi:hypothetical protein
MLVIMVILVLLRTLVAGSGGVVGVTMRVVGIRLPVVRSDGVVHCYWTRGGSKRRRVYAVGA